MNSSRALMSPVLIFLKSSSILLLESNGSRDVLTPQISTLFIKINTPLFARHLVDTDYIFVPVGVFYSEISDLIILKKP